MRLDQKHLLLSDPRYVALKCLKTPRYDGGMISSHFSYNYAMESNSREVLYMYITKGKSFTSGNDDTSRAFLFFLHDKTLYY